jgi:hypothetical protein
LELIQQFSFYFAMLNLPEIRATFDDSFDKNTITASNYTSLIVCFGSSYNRYCKNMTFASGQKSTKGVLSPTSTLPKHMGTEENTEQVLPSSYCELKLFVYECILTCSICITEQNKLC